MSHGGMNCKNTAYIALSGLLLASFKPDADGSIASLAWGGSV